MHGPPRVVRRWLVPLCVLGMGTTLPPAQVAAQSSTAEQALTSAAADTLTGAEPGSEGGGFRLLGRRAERRRVIGGLWTLHPFAISWPRVEETHGFGLLWDGWFGATFVNSHGGRAFTAGVERVWVEPAWRFLALGIGYRAGLVTGYDERLLSWAEDVPAVPFAGLQGWVRAGPARLDAFYVYRVITLELSLELW